MVTIKSRNPAASLFNLPNKLTSARLVLSFVLFLLIWYHQWLASMLLFLVAAATDWLDGYIARQQGLVSSLGRVYDPLVDKILVCGAFIFLLDCKDTALPGGAGVNAWMVTIIIAREFIVTGIRGFLEDKGVSFGADWLGKIKMFLQCAAILWILFALSLANQGSTAPVLVHVRDVLNWSTVGITFISGANYVRRAIEHLS
ncbi:MAG: CDP-diacylglycerol--glycerol-3-phosphate 3-phosphatidyltransferase [Planctomycetota bacterium]